MEIKRRIVKIKSAGDGFDVEVVRSGRSRIVKQGISLDEAAEIFNCEPDAYVVFVDESGNPLMYRTPLDAVDFPSYKPLES
uniref:Uncharacterized protein n=1 Tax=Rhodothermus marinus TaxID=29549 RepID=A0A7V2AZS1_RHOMR